MVIFLKRYIKIIGYVILIFVFLSGIIIILYSDFISPIKCKYTLASGMFLTAFVIRWLLSNNNGEETNAIYALMILLLICMFFISLILFI